MMSDKIIKTCDACRAWPYRRGRGPAPLWARFHRLVVLLVVAAVTLSSISSAYAQQSGATIAISDVIVEESDSERITAHNVAVDGADNRYVLGQFNGAVEFGEDESSQLLDGTNDGFVAKYDAEGNLQWVAKLESNVASLSGGVPSVVPGGIDVDERSSAVYIAGLFVNRLDIGTEILVTNDATGDGFIARLNMNTGEVEWVNQISGTHVVAVNDLDAESNVVITGQFGGIGEFAGQFDTSQTLLAITPGGSDMFVAKYSPVGELVFALQGGGGSIDENRGTKGNAVQMDGGESLMVVGEFAGSARFEDRLGDSVELTSAGRNDGFVARYNRDGQLRYIRQLGGSESDSASYVDLSKTGAKTFVGGSFRGETTIGTATLTSRGENDAFVARFDSLSGNVERVAHAGSDGVDFFRDMDVDEEDNVFVNGRFNSSELVVGDGDGSITLPTTGVLFSAYVAGLDTDLTPIFGQTIQGRFNGNRMLARGNSDIYIAGGYADAVTFGADDATIELPAPSGNEGMAVAHYRLDTEDEVPMSVFYVSSTTSGIVDGIVFQDEDLLAFDSVSQEWTLLIDGSDVGLSATDVDAFHWRPDQTVLMSFNTASEVPGLGLVDDSDIVRFIPTSLGAQTAGTFEMFLVGSDVGLGTDTDNDDLPFPLPDPENIDAIAFTTEGELVVSTSGIATVPTPDGPLTAEDEDLLVRRGDQWELLFDGSDIGLTTAFEDIFAAWIDDDGVHLSTNGNYSLGASVPTKLFGDADDVFTCQPAQLGDETQVASCAKLFNGDDQGIGREIIDAFAIGRAGIKGSAISDDEGLIDPHEHENDGVPQSIFLPSIRR